MANVIALIWDFDKTLLSGYMQDPIFRHYGVDGAQFWREVNALPLKYRTEQNVRVNPDTIYLNHFLHYIQDGTFKGLNNEMLRAFGSQLEFYPGVPEIFQKTKRMVSENPAWQEYDIKVEHYIVSTGMAEIIRGSCVMDEVEAIWGCELIERRENGIRVLSEIGYTIDNTSKTRAIFEINKGTPHHPEIDVNAKIARENRRVPFENMIYIADGPSDVPAFSVINQNGGATFAVYPAGDARAFRQVETLRKDSRINMYAPADYREGTTAFMWITNRITEIAEHIRDTEKQKITAAVSAAPRHLND